MERGGYRLIRMLGGSSGNEVSLCAGPDDEPVVLRIVDEVAADAAVSASDAESPHLAPLLDLFSLPGDRFGLVYPRFSGGSLVQVLARREELRPGEATTILVSVARALSALHEARLAHAGLRVSAVLFDDHGTPVVVDLTSCAPVTAERRAADVRALAVVAAAVLTRVPGSEGLLARVTAATTPAEVEAAMFDAADPRPVDVPAAESPTIEQLLPSRSSPPAEQPPPPSGRTPNPAVRRIRGLGRALRTVRRRVWMPAAGVAAGLVAALLLVPGQGSEASGGAPASPPAPSGALPSELVEGDPAVQGDDPAAAAVALARARDGCLASGADGCLEAVDQPGSSLLAEDLAAVGPAPPTLPASAESPTVQRAGDAALVTIGEVRLLLVRVDGQWRLRDVFAEPPGS